MSTCRLCKFILMQFTCTRRAKANHHITKKVKMDEKAVEPLCLRGMRLIVTNANFEDGIMVCFSSFQHLNNAQWYSITIEREGTTIDKYSICKRFSCILAQLHEPVHLQQFYLLIMQVGKLYGLPAPSKRVLTSHLFSHTKPFITSRINDLQTYFSISKMY